MRRLSLDEMYECAQQAAVLARASKRRKREEIAEAMKRIIDERREACRRPRTSSTT